MYTGAKASEIVRWFQNEACPYRFPRYPLSAAFAAPWAGSFPQPVQKYRCQPGTPPVPPAQDQAFAQGRKPSSTLILFHSSYFVSQLATFLIALSHGADKKVAALRLFRAGCMPHRSLWLSLLSISFSNLHRSLDRPSLCHSIFLSKRNVARRPVKSAAFAFW